MAGDMGEGDAGASVAGSGIYATGDIHDGLSPGRPDCRSILLAIPLLIVIACPGQAVGSDGGAPNLIELETAFPWIDHPLDVNYSVALRSFVYGSAAWPWARHAYGCDSFFLYYEPDLLEQIEDLSASLHAKGREVYVVLDPENPEDGTTFLDLRYDLSLWLELADQLDSTIAALSGLGVDGFVIGDEWPRGLNKGEITVGMLAGHNETYHAETGLWMSGSPDKEDKEALAEWFYARSVEAWRELALELRRRHPDARLGTNIDLTWEPEMAGANVAHWKPQHWWLELDLSPYDFLVTHYYTRINGWSPEDGLLVQPTFTDRSSLERLDDALGALLGGGQGDGLDVYLLLGAHCSYPRITTPMQMVEEWNLAMAHGEGLTGIGWFIFDLWISNDGKSIESMPLADTTIEAPLNMDRLLTVRALLDGARSKSTVALLPGHARLGIEPVWRVMLPSSRERVCGIAGDGAGGCVILVAQEEGAEHGGSSSMLRVDALGNVSWQGPVSSGKGDWIPLALLHADSGYLALGSRNSETILLKLDEEGRLLWEREFAGTCLPRIFAYGSEYLLLSGSGILAVDGSGMNTWSTDLPPDWQVKSVVDAGNGSLLLTGRNEREAFVARIDVAGNLVGEIQCGDWWPLELLAFPDGFLMAGGRERSCDLWCWWQGIELRAINHDGQIIWHRELNASIGEAHGSLAICETGAGFHIGTLEGMALVDFQGRILRETGYDPGHELVPAGMVGNADGSVILVGYSGSAGEAGGGAIYARKFHKEEVWDLVIDDTQTADGIVPGPEGDCFVTGTRRPLGSPTRYSVIFKLDPDGNLIWHSDCATGWDKVDAAGACWDGGLVLAGRSDGGNLHLIRVDGDGEPMWETYHDLGGLARAGSIREDPDGLMVCGTIVRAQEERDIFLLKTDGSGARAWAHAYDVASDEGLILIQSNRSCFLVGNAIDQEGTGRIVAIKVDQLGREIWRTVHDCGGSGTAACAFLAGDGSLVVGGHAQGGSLAGPYLAELDSQGELAWEKTFEWEGHTIVEIARSSDGGYWLFGRGGSMVKLDPDWQHVWDTGWEPVGPGGLVSESNVGTYLMVGTFRSQLQVIRFRDRVPELPMATIIPGLLLGRLAFARKA